MADRIDKTPLSVAPVNRRTLLSASAVLAGAAAVTLSPLLRSRAFAGQRSISPSFSRTQSPVRF